MLVFIIVHLLAGILLGAFFRIAVIIPAAAVIIVESLAGATWLSFAPWYWLIAAGLVSVQCGYGIAAIFRPAQRPRTEQSSARLPPTARISAQE